VHNS